MCASKPGQYQSDNASRSESHHSQHENPQPKYGSSDYSPSLRSLTPVTPIMPDGANYVISIFSVTHRGGKPCTPAE